MTKKFAAHTPQIAHPSGRPFILPQRAFHGWKPRCPTRCRHADKSPRKSLLRLQPMLAGGFGGRCRVPAKKALCPPWA